MKHIIPALLLGIGLAISATPSFATDSTVNNLTPATTPLSGTELIYCLQGGADRKCPASSFGGLLSGTSGGIPYFNSASTWASSGALTVGAIVVGGGAGSAPTVTTTGANVLTAIGNDINAASGLPNVNGSITTGDCLKWGPGVQDSGAACGLASYTFGAGLTNTSGTVTLGDSGLSYAAGSGVIKLGNGAIGAGTYVNTLNPNVTSNATDNVGVAENCVFYAYGNPNLTPGFSDQNCHQTLYTSFNADDVFSAGNTNGQTLAKTTLYSNLIQATYYSGGQKLTTGQVINCHGMSDCAEGSTKITFSGGPIPGDEAQGFHTIDTLQQQGSLGLNTITSVPTQSTMNTTTTQAVTKAAAAQTVTVASNAGCSPSTWVIVAQQAPSATSNEEAVQITACPAGGITAIFRNTFVSGVTITPATVLNVNDAIALGQDLDIVDLSQPSYTTGTITTSNGSGAFTGAGTSWSNSMVGGNATNIGCIYSAADTNTAAPFNGSASQGPLHSYYQIASVFSPTSLGIFSHTTSGSGAYTGIAGSGLSYAIYPCARILYMGNSGGSPTGLIVLESSSSTWSVGDSLETAINPYPDVYPWEYDLYVYTPGGVRGAFMDVRNNGPTQFGEGFSVSTQGQPSGSLQTPAWNIGYIADSANTGFETGPNIVKQAIYMVDGVTQGCATDNCGEINWGNAEHIMPNSTNGGMELLMTFQGTLSAISYAISGGSVDQLKWTGYLTPNQATTPNFSAYPACTSALSGSIANMLGNASAWGATVSGNGSNNVMARCNGTTGNWTVMGD